MKYWHLFVAMFSEPPTAESYSRALARHAAQRPRCSR